MCTLVHRLDIKYREGMEDDREAKSGAAGKQAVAIRRARREEESSSYVPLCHI